MKHPVDIHVGQRIRQRRWMVGMTQHQLGDAVGIKFQQIQKYETGTNRISASRMWDIAAAMEVSVSYFFEGLDDPQPTKGDELREPVSDEHALRTLRAIRSVPGEGVREALVTLLVAVAKNARAALEKLESEAA